MRPGAGRPRADHAVGGLRADADGADHPGPNTPFEAFQYDQSVCKQFAQQQVAGHAENANNQAVGAGVLTTVLGAGPGAAIGGGRGAAIGAASGAGLGAAVGAQSSSNAQYSIQQQYDNAYARCMYAKGNQVPGYAPRRGPKLGYQVDVAVRPRLTARDRAEQRQRSDAGRAQLRLVRP